MGKWEIVKLSEIGKIVTGNTPPTKNPQYYSSNDLAFYKPNDLTETGVLYLNEATTYISESAKPLIRLLPKGSVLVTCIGIIGKVGIALNECTCNQQINAIIPNTNKANSRYIAYCIISRKRYIQNIANAPVVPIVNKTQFSNVKIPLPPLAIQKQIAQTLDTATELLTMRKHQLAELDNLAKSIFYEMFGDPVTNTKKWKVVPLSSLLEHIKYGTSTPPVFSDNGYCFIRTTNIKSGQIVDNDIKYISDSEATKISKCKLQEGDLIIVRSGINTGDTCVISGKYAGQYAGYDLIISPNLEILNTLFLNELINTNYMKYVVKPLTRRAAQPHINAKQVQRLPIILPTIDLQNQFAAIITAIEEQKILVKKAQEETQQLFDSLMSQFFH